MVYEAGTLAPRIGRIVIEIVPRNKKSVEVSVTRTCNKPEIVEYAEVVLREIARVSPGAVIRRVPPEAATAILDRTGRKLGGPAGTPEDQKIKIVKGWFQVQGRMNQEIYANSHGIATTTLRRWIRQLRQAGKL